MGIRFYSRIKIIKISHQAPELKRIAPVLGLVSLIVALPGGLILFVATWLGLPMLLAAGFGIAAQIAITGAMAEDGLADSFDGLFGGNSKQRRLEIMKDSTHGTFGVVAIVLIIATRVFVLAALAQISAIGAVMLWVGAQVFARQSSLWLVVGLSPAKEDGAAAKAGELATGKFWTGLSISALITIIFAGYFVGIGGIIIAAAIVLLIIIWWAGVCKKLVGGYSGDLIGGLQAMLEIGILSGFLVFI